MANYITPIVTGSGGGSTPPTPITGVVKTIRIGEVSYTPNTAGVVTLPEPSAIPPWRQDMASNVWTVPHNLGRRPVVSVVGEDLYEMVSDVRYVDDNIIQIIHGRPMSGWVYFA